LREAKGHISNMDWLISQKRRKARPQNNFLFFSEFQGLSNGKGLEAVGVCIRKSVGQNFVLFRFKVMGRQDMCDHGNC